MEDLVNETLASQRFSTMLLALFAGVALTLASVGIYSVLSYIVRGRRREIGIRSALGAGSADVVRLVVIEGNDADGDRRRRRIVAALASGRLLEKLVFGVSASDPLTLVVVAATLRRSCRSRRASYRRTARRGRSRPTCSAANSAAVDSAAAERAETAEFAEFLRKKHSAISAQSASSALCRTRANAAVFARELC